MDSVLKVFSAFQYIACIAECFCNDGVQYDVRSCNGVTGTCLLYTSDAADE